MLKSRGKELGLAWVWDSAPFWGGQVACSVAFNCRDFSQGASGLGAQPHIVVVVVTGRDRGQRRGGLSQWHGP